MTTLFDIGTPHRAGHREVRPDQVLADRLATRIVDVREPEEFRGDLGHIHGAELIPLASVATACAGWNHEDAVVLVCRSGGRAERVANTLTASGFRRVMNMVGGMLAWNEARLPVEGTSRAR